jgi:hypothetical protein
MRWFWSLIALLTTGGLWFVFSTPMAVEHSPPEPTALPPIVAVPPTTPAPAPPPPTPQSPAKPPVPDLDLLGESGSIVRPKPALLTDARSPNDIVRRIDDRTLELDGRFRIIGNGRADDPYRISWELLTSANAYIDPTVKALTPPPWVRALDGTYIEISGYYSTAVRVSAAKNLLLTLNRWDGCCIGLPPTPFDAIDMDMREPVMMQGLHLFRFATFRGRLVISPFETGGFLLGLYRLEDTTLQK